MNIEKVKTELGTYDIKLIQDNKIMNIVYSKGDLYWNLCVEEDDLTIFEITEENKIIYELFDNLYNSIEQCKVYELDPIQISNCKDQDVLNQMKKRISWMNQYVKLYNKYNKLFHDGIIEWHSDDQLYQDANIVEIYKEKGKFIIKYIFKNNDAFLVNSIKFSNYESLYNPFNLLFIKMYNKLKEYDYQNEKKFLYQKKKN